MLYAVAVVAFGMSAALSAQTAAGIPAPDSLIDELVANAEHYRATLPSLTADESIDSETSFMGLLPDRTRAQGTFRVLRAPQGQDQGKPADDERLQESRQITMLNGKPVEPGAKVHIPFSLFGGFGSFQQMFFTSAHRACFDFRVLPRPGANGTIQIAVAAKPSSAWPQGCPVSFQGATGLVLIDPVNHQPVHFERTVPDLPTRGNLAPFASVDCASTKVGDQTFWLPTKVEGRNTGGKIHGHFIAHYSNYHRYAASIKLLPGATDVESSPDPDASAPPPAVQPSTPH